MVEQSEVLVVIFVDFMQLDVVAELVGCV